MPAAAATPMLNQYFAGWNPYGAQTVMFAPTSPFYPGDAYMHQHSCHKKKKQKKKKKKKKKSDSESDDEFEYFYMRYPPNSGGGGQGKLFLLLTCNAILDKVLEF